MKSHEEGDVRRRCEKKMWEESVKVKIRCEGVTWGDARRCEKRR
jgi:hypothetical protein